MITGCIVTYNNDIDELSNAINSFLDTNLHVKLYISDNSKNDNLKEICNDERVEYIFNNCNLGFGVAHNIAIKKAIEDKSNYHLILNPDVTFDSTVLSELTYYMNKNSDIGLISPKIYYPNGDLQRLCKLFPTPLDFFVRRFIPLRRIQYLVNKKYELHNFSYNQVLEVPLVSGCFFFCRTTVLEDIGGFDDRYFMYLEDFDLCQRIGFKNKVIFYPNVSIIHRYERGAHKSLKLMLIFINSTIKYFNKWGWFMDTYRKSRNKKTLEIVNKG